MRQLPLEVGRADDAVFATYQPGSNASAVHAVRDLAESGRPGCIWLWGGEGSGRSHLLQAAVAAAHERGSPAAYLPSSVMPSAAPELLEGIGGLRLAALDDIDRRAGHAGWERALFRCYEDMLAGGGALVLAAATPPAQAGFQLPDLVSRFCAASVFRLLRLSDEECVEALQLRAGWRGFELPADTARYLLGRVDRSTPALFDLLGRLDRAALAAQRRLSIPFVRDLLASDGPQGN